MLDFETETEVKKSPKGSKEVTMKHTGSFSVGEEVYNFKAGEAFTVSSQKHLEAFEREIIRRGKLDGTYAN